MTLYEKTTTAGGKLDPSLVDIGVKAWNAATQAVQIGLIEKGKV